MLLLDLGGDTYVVSDVKKLTMRQKTLLILILITIILNGCRNELATQDNSNNDKQTKPVRINPLNNLKQVDKLLAEIAEKPQRFTVTSNKVTLVTGLKGTIIHVDPNRLETIDGSPLGDNIQIELLEMTDNCSMLLNNAQTVSNGQILVTGGAYYFNMNSNGKQLKMKQGKGIKVEFPKLTENEMELFLGERDSLGQINWIPTNKNFKSKVITDAKKPAKPIKEEVVAIEIVSELDNYLSDSLAAPEKVSKEDVSEEEYKKYLKKVKEYEELKKEIEYQRQTYQAVELMNFGWINCDRFYNDSNPKTDIQLIVNSDSLQGARIFAVFKDIRSVMTEYYFKGRKESASFRNIPKGKELTIIALSAKDQTPYIFETTINTESDRQVQVEFVRTTQIEIKEKMKRMN